MDNTVVFEDFNDLPKNIALTKNNSSYVTIDKIPEDLLEYSNKNYKKLYELHPTNKHKIIIHNNEMQVNRYSKSYLNTPDMDNIINQNHSYMYSGFEKNVNDELPNEFVPYYDYFLTKNSNYNQAIVNWYDDGNDYIAYHSDCMIGLIENSSITMVNLNENNDDRKIVFKAKNIIEEEDNFLVKKFEIPLINGLVVEMNGKIQNEFRHGVPKLDINNDNFDKSRISISFRQAL